MRQPPIPLRAAIFFLLVAASGAAVCQEPEDSTRTYTLDPVVVTATQIEALRSNIPSAVSLITKADIKTSGETSVLPLISRMVPGAFVTERGVLGYGVAQGAAGTIMIRGMGGSPNTQVLVMTDGRPQLMGLMGHPLPDTYVSSGVERVEVIRGPASLLHGTNAMGGVVNIIYEKPSTAGLGADLGASYGTFNTQKYELSGVYGLEGGGIRVSGNHYETDGHRPYSSFQSSTGAVRGHAAFGDYKLSADVNLTNFRTYDPGPASAPRIDNWVDITRGSSGFAIENHHGRVQGALKAFYNWGQHDIYDGFHSTDNNLGVLLYQGLRLIPENVTTVGVDFKRYGGNAENRTSGVDFGEHFITEYSAYLLTQQRILEILNLSAGVRFNRHSLFGWESVPQVGLAIQATASTTLKASASKGFRSPTIRELYLFPAPTPTLEPERMWNYETGVLQRLGYWGELELNVFLAEGSNIVRTSGMFPNLTLNNSGTFVHRGVELSGRVSPLQSLELDFSYSYLNPGDQTNANPGNKAYVAATYALQPLTMTLSVQHVSDLYGADNAQLPLPDYALFNARLTAALGYGLSVYVAGENLLDREYQILYDYPMPGRTLFGGVNLTLR